MTNQPAEPADEAVENAAVTVLSQCIANDQQWIIRLEEDLKRALEHVDELGEQISDRRRAIAEMQVALQALTA